MTHHQLQEGMSRTEGEGVVGDAVGPCAGLDGDVPVVSHVVEAHVVRVEIEPAIPPDQEDPEGVGEVDHGVLTSLVVRRLEK